MTRKRSLCVRIVRVRRLDRATVRARRRAREPFRGWIRPHPSSLRFESPTNRHDGRLTFAGFGEWKCGELSTGPAIAPSSSSLANTASSIGSPLSRREALAARARRPIAVKPGAGARCVNRSVPSVMVPVLSEQIVVIRPMFSTETARRTRAPRFARRYTRPEKERKDDRKLLRQRSGRQRDGADNRIQPAAALCEACHNENDASHKRRNHQRRDEPLDGTLERSARMRHAPSGANDVSIDGLGAGEYDEEHARPVRGASRRSPSARAQSARPKCEVLRSAHAFERQRIRLSATIHRLGYPQHRR